MRTLCCIASTAAWCARRAAAKSFLLTLLLKHQLPVLILLHAFCTLLHPFRDWFGILPCCIVSSLLHVLCTLLLWRLLCILRSSAYWFILNVLCTILRFEQGSCILSAAQFTLCPIPQTHSTSLSLICDGAFLKAASFLLRTMPNAHSSFPWLICTSNYTA